MIKKSCIYSLALALLGSGLAFSEAKAKKNAHYLCDYPREKKELYQYFRWSPTEFPVNVYIPPVPSEFNLPKDAQHVLWVRQAFRNWYLAWGKMRFTFVNHPKKADITIRWRESFSNGEGTWGWAFYPIPYENEDGELRHRSLINLAVKAQERTAITGVPTFFSEEEFTAIATHEVGHALGLPHSSNPNDLMTPAVFRLSTNFKWQISQNDLATLKFIYNLPEELDESPCP